MMSQFRLFLAFLLLMSPGLLAQSNPGLQEYERRQEEMALQRARQMKAAKAAAVEQSKQEAARGIMPPTVTARPSAAAVQPPQFRLITSQGTVTWTPGTPMPIAPPAPPAPTRKEAREPGIRTVKFALTRPKPNASSEDGEGATVVPLQGSGAPLAEASPATEEEAEEETRTSRWARREQNRTLTEETEVEEVVAVVEDVPGENGEPGRTRILGVLMRGPKTEDSPQAEETSETVASVDESVAKKRSGPMLISFNRKTTEPPEVAEEDSATDEESIEEVPELSSDRKYAAMALRNLFEKPRTDLKADGEGAIESPELEESAEVMEVASISQSQGLLTKWFHRSQEEQAVEGGAAASADTDSEKEAPTGPVNPDFFTIATNGAPFHVIDNGPNDTFMMELEQGAVGRTHGAGEDWTWLEMHDGLMGLMRKKHLRPSRESEVLTFLAMESSTGQSAGREPIEFVEIELPDLPSEAADAGMMLGQGLLPPMTEPGSQIGEEEMTENSGTEPEPLSAESLE